MSDNTITLQIDNTHFKRDMERFAKQSETHFKKAIREATFRMVKHAKLKVRNYTRSSKVKSGFLINNITPTIMSNGLTGEVISKAAYSQAFEEGTRPHGIVVKNKKVLAGPYRGRPSGWNVSKGSAGMGFATYGKKVHHPGTRPHPFMYPAWKYAIQEFEKLMRAALK